MQRVDMKHLESVVKTLNEVAGRPVVAWADGKGQIGNFHIYGDQCGYALHCVMNEGGGVHSHASGRTKRELLDIVRGMIAGVLIGKSMPVQKAD